MRRTLRLRWIGLLPSPPWGSSISEPPKLGSSEHAPPVGNALFLVRVAEHISTSSAKIVRRARSEASEYRYNLRCYDTSACMQRRVVMMCRPWGCSLRRQTAGRIARRRG